MNFDELYLNLIKIFLLSLVVAFSYKLLKIINNL